MKPTLLLTALLFCSLLHAQQCKIHAVKGDRTVIFDLKSPVTKKAWLTVNDNQGHVKWAKKVKIKKGETQPRLVFLGLEAGNYVISIGDFFKQDVRL